MQLKDSHKSRNVSEVGEGDYVLIGSTWKRITHNTAAGEQRIPKDWTVTTEGGNRYSMYEINRYAKAEDLTE